MKLEEMLLPKEGALRRADRDVLSGVRSGRSDKARVRPGGFGLGSHGGGVALYVEVGESGGVCRILWLEVEVEEASEKSPRCRAEGGRAGG